MNTITQKIELSSKSKSQRYRDRLKAQNICTVCCKAQARPGKVHCAECAKDRYERGKEYSKNYKNKLRDMVFEAYGDSCVCCGETNPLFLTLDHINNDGNKHRRELFGGQNRGGYHMHLW